MASRQQHSEQWLHNRAFLQSLLNRQDISDWITTVAFYTAVHAVQVLLLGDHNDRAVTHESRNAILKEDRRYSSIWPDYKALYDASRVARYDCSGWLNSEAVREELVKRRLQRLESHVIKLAKLKMALPNLFP